MKRILFSFLFLSLSSHATYRSNPANFFAKAVWPITVDCMWQKSGGTYTVFGADADCVNPSGGGLVGNASAPATKVPGLTISNMIAGVYRFDVLGSFISSGTSSCEFRLYDGTNSYDEQQSGLTGTVDSGANSLSFVAIYSTDPGTLTFQLQNRELGIGDCSVDAQEVPLTFNVGYSPLVN